MELSLEHDIEDLDPMDLVESVLSADDRFTVERTDDGDVQFIFADVAPGVVGHVAWRAELPAVLFTLAFPDKAPPEKLADAQRLSAIINEHLWLGHFDVWSDDGAIMFRHAVAMIGRSELVPGEVQAMMAASMDAADRFLPAFALLLAGGQTPEEAAQVGLFDIVGEA
jgi:hypothetical protein